MADFNSVHRHQPFPCTDFNLHGKWRSRFAKTESYCIVGVICLEVSAEIKNLSHHSVSIGKQCLLLPFLIACDPSEQCVFPGNQKLHLIYDLLILFSVEIHISFIVIAPNENKTDVADEANICTLF